MKLAACCVGTALLLAGSYASSQEVYRTVDESGEVTYSDTPPAPDAKSNIVDLPPPPSQQRVEEAKQRAEQERQMSNQLEQERRHLENERKAERERRANQATRQESTAPLGRVGRYPYALPPDHDLPDVPIAVPGPGDHPIYAPGPVPTPLPSGGAPGGL